MRGRWFFVLIARNHSAQFAQIGERAFQFEPIAGCLLARFGQRIAHLDQAVLDERDPGFQIDQPFEDAGGIRIHGCCTERPRPMP